MRATGTYGACLCALLAMALVGCASRGFDEQSRQRDAVQRMGADVAERLIEATQWDDQTVNQLILVARPSIAPDAQLPEAARVDAARLSSALSRGLLALPDAPQVIGWAPQEQQPLAPQLWILDSSFSTGPTLGLSDRELYPYHLELKLHRAGRPAITFETDGAFDSLALGTLDEQR
ncbi:hypothetical protein [Halotalea alkalilenta]|uniref:Uncharacterized protein n=1 Tax=Halotalea alkalilenta TaxID=376489 RepID=A0A172YBW2_9GAMM|nr:hypothetical protein [Halotalea alkalilenta]ANF56708.1 hypothetical protein A5892_03865 [Halotalea alkalilenta]